MKLLTLSAIVAAVVVVAGCAPVATQSTGDGAKDYPWSVTPVPQNQLPPSLLVVIDDFEKGTPRWTQRGDGSMGVEVAIIDDAPEGKKAAKISFYGNRDLKKWNWVNILWYIDGGGWPAEGKYLVFWAKAPSPCKIMVNLHEGPPKMQNEFFGATIDLTTEWKKYKIPVEDFKTYIWGHKEGNKKLDIDRTILVGINQRSSQPDLTFPVTFMIDAITIEKE